MPMCQAMLQNQAKNMTCQKVNLTWPGWGAPPVQMTVLAMCQKSPTDFSPICRSPIMPKAANTSTIHGAAMLAKRETNR
jgi:hypothetical protein